MIPDDVRQLLRDGVQTYEQLEVLMLFAVGARTWTAGAAAERLHFSAEAAAEALESLARTGVIQRVEGDPQRFVGDPTWGGAVDALRAAYQADRLGIMNLMTTNALERVRTSAIRAFAASFVLGKKDHG